MCNAKRQLRTYQFSSDRRSRNISGTDQKKYGIETNQSIVSRDLRQLGVSKHQVNNRMVYELKEYDASREILRLAIIDVDHNESLIVIKTLPGLADFVGDYLDMQEDLPMLGNIAGENTIFVTPLKQSEIEYLFKEVCTALYYKKSSNPPYTANIQILAILP